MTLVLTEVSRFGVAMAADSAITFRSTNRVYIGAQKLLPVYQINAGLSIWGRGHVNNIDADVWVQNFIENAVTSGMSLWEMANILAENLNEAFGRVISERMGIHVGGFDEKNGIRGPAFYHVHNGHAHAEFRSGEIINVPDEDPPIREFRAHDDCPPIIYTQNDFPVTANGDFPIFVFLYQNINNLLLGFQQAAGLIFPHPPGLETRGEYLRFWINIIKEIYRLSNARPRILPQPATAGDASIGGPVTILTISDSRIENFYSK